MESILVLQHLRHSSRIRNSGVQRSPLAIVIIPDDKSMVLPNARGGCGDAFFAGHGST